MTNNRKQELLALSRRMEVEFKDLAHLDAALTHTSYANEKKAGTVHNERLEFLGDAVLELSSSTYLYVHFPQMPEGNLTKTRAAIVCQATLARLAEKLGLGEVLLLGRGEEQMGGRLRPSNLEDAFEAVIGAVYVDRGWEVACDYVWRQLATEFAKVKQGKTQQDYKTVLQELIQQRPGAVLSYELLTEEGPPHARLFTVAVKVNEQTCGTGKGRSKKEAEQLAAREALEKGNMGERKN